MKKNKKLVQLALLGLTNGLLLNAPGILFAENQKFMASESTDIASKETILTAGCKGQKGGCNTVASSCKNRCNAIANRDLSEQQKLQDPSKLKDNDVNSESLGYHVMTEQELLLELNSEGTKQYNSLTPEGKALAREVASQRCGRTNQCKGLNACETEKNKCAGKGACKNLGKCAFSDTNVAIKVVAEKMAQKRAQSIQKK